VTPGTWKEAIADPEERLLAALRFVQDEIRYLAIAFGTGSYQPNDPGTVFARRFGDCKDKTILLCVILREMGIDAAPALVHTTARHTIEQYQPSPGAFDHVVAEVRLGESVLWVDPTRTHQRGPLSARFFPPLGRALVIRPETTRLTVIPASTRGLPRTTVHETFEIQGRLDPVQFQVVTIAEGLDAERLRAELAEIRRAELEKNYLNYYARQYPNIEISRPL
jgi:hypothetical protein